MTLPTSPAIAQVRQSNGPQGGAGSTPRSEPVPMRELSRLCDIRRIRVQDLRGRNGNLWVLTDDRDRYVNSQLQSWGFSFKADKGWWRK
jgi:hypothetical protein